MHICHGLVGCVHTTADYPRSRMCLLCICVLSPFTLLCSKRDSITQLKRRENLVYALIQNYLQTTPISVFNHLFYQLDMWNVLAHGSLLNGNRQFCEMQFIDHVFCPISALNKKPFSEGS